MLRPVGIRFFVRLGTLIPGVPVSAVSLAASLGASFALSGVTWRPGVSAGGSSGFSVAVCCDSVSSLVAFAPRIYGECFVGLMARNPASYVSSLTLVT